MTVSIQRACLFTHSNLQTLKKTSLMRRNLPAGVKLNTHCCRNFVFAPATVQILSSTTAGQLQPYYHYHHHQKHHGSPAARYVLKILFIRSFSTGKRPCLQLFSSATAAAASSLEAIPATTAWARQVKSHHHLSQLSGRPRTFSSTKLLRRNMAPTTEDVAEVLADRQFEEAQRQGREGIGKKGKGKQTKGAGAAPTAANGGKKREKQISMALSKLLRHQALSAGIVLDKEGYAPLEKVVSLQFFPNFLSLPSGDHISYCFLLDCYMILRRTTKE